MIEEAASYGLLLARVGGFVAFGPWHLAVPARGPRLGLAVALSLAWWPHVQQVAARTAGDFGLLGLVAREILLGAAAGYAVALFLLPAQMAGDFVGRQIGLAMAELTDPATASPSHPMTQLFSLIAVAIYFCLDAHQVWILLLDELMRHWPLGTWELWGRGEAFVAGLDRGYDAGIRVVAPLVVVSFSVLTLVALLSKASPVFGYFSVGLTVQLVAGLLALVVFIPSAVSGLSSGLLEWLRWLSDLTQ
jgi:flagellar biosynthesis protein FliR